MPLIIGIGASAGGLEAFKSFFTNTPANTGMAFVLVQHLSPDHKSMLAELLGKTTEMDVIEAVDGVTVKANCVFVIPPDATMTIAGGRLKVVKPAPPRDRRRPIDTFLQSLADDQGENAVCIILSGTGSDGTLGLAAIREKGGLTLAQAEYDHHALPGMPQSAAATGQVDEVLAVEAMPARLAAYQAHLNGVAASKDSDGIRTDAVSHMATIMGALRARSGHDFSGYKEKTLVRRLQRRMQLLQVDTPAAYIELFRKQPEELDLLFRELLIGVTQFFRDPDAFDVLNENVLKGLVSGKGAHETVRVWVAGCATGEEAYTLAILLREAMDARRPKPKVQIFATDIDDRAIAAARVGRYRGPVAGVSPERLERWFKQEGDDYCVVPEIREMCVFSTHSVIKDPPFSKLDLISCRNLLIYIDPPMQDRVMHSFHYALKPGGRLFLGSSESVTRTTKLFSMRDKKQRIFERREVDGAMLPNLSSRGAGLATPVPPSIPQPGSSDHIEKGARRAMEKHNPPHVVIDRHHQIVRFSGAALGRYFEPATGAPSFALFDILRRPLRSAVRKIVQEVQASKVTVRHSNVALRIEGTPHLLMLIAEPMDDDGEFIVLAFQDGGSDVQQTKSPTSDVNASDAMRAMEQDLLTTRTQLQSTIDELETANEEMKSSNEEYQSVNEELQSSNEELETAKEEMQSVNEELHTINVEMAGKNEQLTHLNSDIKNLLESTEIATLFLDEHLRIKSFTRGISDLFNVRDSDVGRPITEISSLLDYSELQRDVKTVLRKLVMTERRVMLTDASMTFEMRVRPYRTIDNVIDGVVCTFVDITAREAADAALRASEQQFHVMAESIPQLAWIMDGAGYIFWYNKRWFDYTNTTLEDMKGWGWQSVHHPDELDRVVKHLKHCIATGEIWEDTFPLRGADGSYRTFLSRAEPCRDDSGKIVRWFGTNTDIEDQRRSEAELRRLATLIDLSFDAIMMREINGLITSWNKGAEALYGYTAEQAVGKISHTLLKTGFPEPLAEIDRRLTEGDIWRGELVHTTRDGRVVTVLARWQPTTPDENGHRLIMETNTDISESKAAEAHRSLLLAEVNHRAKNMLAVVQAVARQTAASGDPATLVDRLSNRIASLAESHDLLVKDEWRGTELSDLVRSQLLHFKSLIGTRVAVDGPPIRLSAASAQAIGMALHELATNAGKYGAISNNEGRVLIRWDIMSAREPRFVMSWREEGGPAVSEPQNRGFGHTVIVAMVQHAIDGTVELDFHEAGISWRVDAPLDHIMEGTTT